MQYKDSNSRKLEKHFWIEKKNKFENGSKIKGVLIAEFMFLKKKKDGNR